MNGDIEELLREGLDRFTADVRAPAELLTRARAHLRRRQIAVRVALAGGTAAVIAAVTAAAVIAAAGPGRGVPGPVRARTAAYVIQRVERALTAPNGVIQTETTFSPAFPAITQWNYRHNVRSVQSGLMRVPGLPWAQGQVSWVDGTATIRGKRTYVAADYRHHEWYPLPGFLVVPNGCKNLNLAESNSANWAAYVRQTLSCGEFKVAGHAPINGKETIKITGSMTQPHWWKDHALRVDATLYVDPSTYLPVRITWSNWTHAADGKRLYGIARQDIRLLPATPRNIAKARVLIPAGFRRVRGAPFGGPVFQFVG
jgi:hypothetical protein